MSKRERILSHLKRGYAITPLQALKRYGCFSLSQRIGELKRQGFAISSELVREGRRQYARYRIEQ